MTEQSSDTDTITSGYEEKKVQRSDKKGSESKVNQVNPKCGVVTNKPRWRRALQSPVDEEKRKKV